jgi:hypothetical protein
MTKRNKGRSLPAQQGSEDELIGRRGGCGGGRAVGTTPRRARETWRLCWVRVRPSPKVYPSGRFIHHAELQQTRATRTLTEFVSRGRDAHRPRLLALTRQSPPSPAAYIYARSSESLDWIIIPRNRWRELGRH